MTEKQFIEPYEECRVIKNIYTGETATYYDTEDGLMFLKWLNNLSDENEQLKQQIKELQEFKDNYDKNMELIHNSEYVQDFLHGNL